MPLRNRRVSSVFRTHKLHDSTPEHVDFLVKDRAGWEEHIKPKLTPDRRRINFEAYRNAKANARRANRYGSSKHDKALPLYTKADAERAVQRIVAILPGRQAEVDGVSISMSPVGHLLGASAVTLSARRERVVFSGDLGRSDDLLLPPPQPLTAADVLLVEATYGNRVHPRQDAQQRLGEIIVRTIGRGGSVLMPSFAVGRAQALLLVLQRLSNGCATGHHSAENFRNAADSGR